MVNYKDFEEAKTISRMLEWEQTVGFSVTNNCFEDEQSSLPVRCGDIPTPRVGLTCEGVPKRALPSCWGWGCGHLHLPHGVV